MKTNTQWQTLICVLASLATFAARAQSVPLDQPLGVLGQRFGEIGAAYVAKTHGGPDFREVNFGGNLPVTPNLDLGGGLGFASATGAFGGDVNDLNTNATWHGAHEGLKPFITAGLDYRWTTVMGANDVLRWRTGAGFEVPVGRFASLMPRLDYTDDFRNGARSAQVLRYATEANVWITRTTALFASGGYEKVHHSPLSAWVWHAGARFTF